MRNINVALRQQDDGGAWVWLTSVDVPLQRAVNSDDRRVFGHGTETYATAEDALKAANEWIASEKTKRQ